MRSSSLKDKKILLAVTGGIAVYKAAELVGILKKEGASVTVLMTEASQQFVSSLTFESLTGNRTHSDIFSTPMAHISASDDADLFLIVPATANIIGKIASGVADDIVTLSLLAFRGPVLFAPAMNWRMYENPIVKRNIKALEGLGFHEVKPESGKLACGDTGIGRLAPLSDILEAVKSRLCNQDLSGLKVTVTAGPTREYIDPVRFISNRSSGRMGYALADVAMRRGAEVKLISGPVAVKAPYGVNLIKVDTSEEMLKAVKDNLEETDLLIMAAAVSDYTPETPLASKKEKESNLSLTLKTTPDILKTVSKDKKRTTVIGFSAETGGDLSRPRKKLIEKGMDIIVFNDVTDAGAGFDHETNKISIIDNEGTDNYPLMSKTDCAERIIDHYLKRKASS